MKSNLLTNLMVVLALGLCGLCTFQWLREARSRAHIEHQNQVIFEARRDIQGYTNNIHTLDHQVAQLDLRISELKSTIKTNDQLILELRREKSQALATNEFLSRHLEAYTNALADAQEKLKQASEGIRKQNEAIKEVAAQRDEFVAKLNESIRERNKLVGDYNQLVDQHKKLQEESAALIAALQAKGIKTNAPAKLTPGAGALPSGGGGAPPPPR